MQKYKLKVVLSWSLEHAIELVFCFLRLLLVEFCYLESFICRKLVSCCIRWNGERLWHVILLRRRPSFKFWCESKYEIKVIFVFHFSSVSFFTPAVLCLSSSLLKWNKWYINTCFLEYEQEGSHNFWAFCQIK